MKSSMGPLGGYSNNQEIISRRLEQMWTGLDCMLLTVLDGRSIDL